MQLVLAPTVEAETVFPVFRTGNYAPVHDELTEFDLSVEGSIPAELNGWYLRNGPNPRAGEGHWCVGDGMVHGVRLENGRAAWYRNRWVRTESFDDPFPPTTTTAAETCTPASPIPMSSGMPGRRWR